MTQTVTIAAHAKANLLLRVLNRGTDGYHGIETVFTLLDLADQIRVERTGGGVHLEVDGADTGPAHDNLAVRAARMVLEATGVDFGVAIQLQKHIPVRAGLGGGSSDGAAVLQAVNHLTDNALPRHELLQFGAKLGSDVPFFVSGAPMALAWNRGERLFRLPAPPTAPALVAVATHAGISTPDAYARLDAAGDPTPRGSVVLDAEALRTWGGIARLGGNDFESVIWAAHPDLRETFERLAQTRPLLCRLSGTGSAIVAIYRTPADRDDAAAQVGTRDRRLIATTTRPAPGPAPMAHDTESAVP